MIWKWFVRRSELERLEMRLVVAERDAVPPRVIHDLEKRIGAMEHGLPATQSLADDLDVELRRLDQQMAAASLAIIQATKRVDALRRIARRGEARLQQLVSQIGDGEDAITSQGRDVAKVAASIAMIEHRLDTEIEQSYRTVTGLLERIELLRPSPRPNPLHGP